jgi:hypothetical protein
MYSYEWLENLIGADLHNAERIVPEWQNLQVGDEFRLASAQRYPDAKLLVAEVNPPRLLALRSPNVDRESPASSTEFGYSWAFVLEPLGPRKSRVLVRSRYQGPRTVVLLLEFVQFVMERKLLLGLKVRAERMAHTTVEDQPAGASAA